MQAPPTIPTGGRLVSTGEVRLWVEADGDGPPLLLVPGLGAGAWLWAPLRQRLARRFRLVMPELRGGPRSDRPDARYGVPGFAADMVGLLDALGLERVHVLGASLGGFVAQHLAAHHPERVDRLVLAATAVGGLNQIGPTGDVLARTIRPRGRTRRERLEDGYALGFSSDFRAARPDVLEAVTAWRTAHPQPEAAYYRQLLAGTAYDGEPHTPRIQAPTLVLAGADDPIIPVENARAIQALLPHAEVAVLPGRHLFFLEHADDVADRVLGFLRAPAPAAPAPPPRQP